MRDLTVKNFDEDMGVCEMHEVKDCQSRWGNSYCYITEEQIEQLKNGKVLWNCDGEYCTFIVLRKECE